MIPILYDSSEQNFTSNGLGRLSDIISCIVTEERNGKFEVEFDYPISGALYSEIKLGRYIVCSTATGKKQPFEIYDSTKPLNGRVTFRARHISYRLSMIPVAPFTATSASDALDGLVSHAMEANPFSFWSNVSTAATYNQTTPASARSRLGGTQGSVLDVFGGEYEWDYWTVKLWTQRGIDRGVVLRYGKNLTSLSQEESIENTITGIVPFYSGEEGTVVGDLISTASAANYPYPRSICVDLSDQFENLPTKAQVNAAGQTYINTHSIGVPEVSLKVSFINLADTEEYKGIAALETVYLCDTVTVQFDRLGVSAEAKVIAVEWNSLTDKYENIEIGSARSTLSDTIVAQEQAIKSKPSKPAMQKAIDNATDLITGNQGGYVMIHKDELTGEPFEILIMDTQDINTATNVWRWNQSGWGHSSTGYAGPYTLAATLDGGIVADFITAGTITGIAINNGNGSFKVDAAGNVTIGKGSININNGVFKVDSNGAMKATSGEFTGAIKSGSTITCGTQFSVDAAGNVKATHLTVGNIYSSGDAQFITEAPASKGIHTNGQIVADGGISGASLSVTGSGGIGGNLGVTGVLGCNGDFYTNGAATIGATQTGHGHVITADTANGYFRPAADGGSYLGAASQRWITVYAQNGLIDISDRNHKKNIEELDERYLMLFDKLIPVSYMFTYPESDRTHVGFISQDIEQALEECGLTALDFGGFCKDILTRYDEETEEYVPVLDEHGNLQYIYSLRYDEFIALNTAAIKRLMARIERLEERYEQADD